jgi:hypothetical protein
MLLLPAAALLYPPTHHVGVTAATSISTCARQDSSTPSKDKPVVSGIRVPSRVELYNASLDNILGAAPALHPAPAPAAATPAGNPRVPPPPPPPPHPAPVRTGSSPNLIRASPPPPPPPPPPMGALARNSTGSTTGAVLSPPAGLNPVRTRFGTPGPSRPQGARHNAPMIDPQAIAVAAARIAARRGQSTGI